MKKAISAILVLVVLCAALPAPIQAAQPDEVSPRYVTADYTTTDLTIDAAGNVSVNVALRGKSGVTNITVTTYLEQKIGSAWYRARVNPWVYETSNSVCAATFSGHVNNSGTYRARSVFTVTGTTTETITEISEYIY